MRITPEFQNKLRQIARSGSPLRLTVNELLGSYLKSNTDGKEVPVQKKGSSINSFINRSIGQMGVQCHPPFEYVEKNEFVELTRRKGKDRKQVYISLEAITSARTQAQSVDQFKLAGKVYEIIASAANRHILIIEEKTKRATGIISWESIAQKCMAGGVKPTVAKDLADMNLPAMHNRDQKLLDVIGEITKLGYSIIAPDENYNFYSVVSIQDIAAEMVQLSKAFHLIEEIEWRVRALFSERINPDPTVIKSWANPSSAYKESAEDIWDLSFGELTFQLKDDIIWEKLELPFNKKDFRERMVRVTRLRNERLHFRPKSLDDDDLCYLEGTCSMLAPLTSSEVEL